VELVVSLLLLNGLGAIFAEGGGRVLDQVTPFIAGVESWVLTFELACIFWRRPGT
jgi:hypothetical protein